MVIGVLVLAVVAQGFYLWSLSLSLWPGPGQAPTSEQGLLVSQATSAVLLLPAVATVVLVHAVAFGVVMGVWALLLLAIPGLWVVVGVPGLVLVIVLGARQLVMSRRRGATVNAA